VIANGVAYCWGSNDYGQLGGGFIPSQLRPRAVAEGSIKFRKVSAGTNHTCGVAADGRAYCWGLNASGQLGDNTRSLRRRPVPVAPPAP
jgi:alpha-tubulin suppressor-like RCC1 family protein